MDIIIKKRGGGTLGREEIVYILQRYTKGEIPDYRAAAWLMMVVCCRGMCRREIADLTRKMADSGDR